MSIRLKNSVLPVAVRTALPLAWSLTRFMAIAHHRGVRAGIGAAAAIVLTACGSTVHGTAVAGLDKGPVTAVPVPVASLEGALLDAPAINTAMGVTGMTGSGVVKLMYDNGNQVEPACLGVGGNAQEKSYDGSGWSAIRVNDFHQPVDDYADWASEAVVSFPSAKDASAFYSASVKDWPACANRRYSFHRSDGRPDTVWTVGDISTTDGMLSTEKTQEGGNGWACQRALTASNNVVVDVMTCSYNPHGTSARDIARDVAARIPTK